MMLVGPSRRMEPCISMPRRPLVALLVAVMAVTATAAFAQRIFVGGGGFRRAPLRWVSPQDFDGSWNYCRGFYTSNHREAGGAGWSTDYPGADNNFSVRLSELTFVRVKLGLDGQPNNVVLRLTDPLLYRCPLLFMEDSGTVVFSENEVQQLRNYFRKGGFLWVDDFWGSRAWQQWAAQIGRVLPSGEYPIVDIPPDHPIMHTLYDVKAIPQVSAIAFWYRNRGAVSERGQDSPHSNFRGIQDSQGRLIVVMTHNTDISDTWEREGENKEYFTRFSPDGYAIGVNVVLYALTH